MHIIPNCMIQNIILDDWASQWCKSLMTQDQAKNQTLVRPEACSSYLYYVSEWPGTHSIQVAMLDNTCYQYYLIYSTIL